MNNLMIMYHYVRDNSTMKCMSIKKFADQVKYLKSSYEILTLSEALDYKGRRKTCVLTFDDGLKDSITNILSVFQELNVKGVFFIPSAILKEKKILHVQKRHLLLSKLGTGQLVDELNEFLPAELTITADPIFKADYLDDLLTCSMKWMLDYLDPQIIEPILQKVFNKFYPDEESIFDNMYLNRSDIKKMIEAGMEIGVHGYTHRQLGSMTFDEQDKEISAATSALKDIVGSMPLYMSYPSGSYNPLTIRLLKKYNYDAAVTIKKYENSVSTPRYEMGRFDCIDI